MKTLLETPKKNLTKVHKSKKALKHRTVGSANVPVCVCIYIYMYVSENSGTGTPKTSILMGFSTINHPLPLIFGNTHIFWPNDHLSPT